MKPGSVGMVAAVVIALAAACGGSTSSVPSGGAAQACSDAATAACDRVAACSPFLVQYLYGDVQTCASRFQSTCTNAATAHGTGWTPTAEEACAKAVPGETCADVVSNNPPSACRASAGQLANGVACGDPSQCQSQYCNLGTSGTCGACATRAASACNRDQDCNYGQVCVTGGCVAPGLSGSTCDGTHPCNKTLACKNGTCAAPDQAGASCVVGDKDNLFGSCDELQGLYCHAVSRVCTALPLVKPGQPCGLVNGGLTGCYAFGACPQAGGTCTAALADGASCTAKDHCMPPAECSGGVCKLPDPSTCQ